MSIVESLNLSPIRVRRRRNQEEEESIEHELKKYFIPAYEPKDNLRREQNILLKMKENERLYDEAYENFRKRKETNPNFGYTKHRNKLSKRKKQKSEADLFAIKNMDLLGHYKDHPNFKKQLNTLHKFSAENKRRTQAVKKFRENIRRKEKQRRDEFFDRRAKREKQIHDRLLGSKQLIQEKAMYEKVRRLKKRNQMLVVQDMKNRKRNAEWYEKREKMKIVEIGKTLLKDQQTKYRTYARLRSEVETIQRKDEMDFFKRYGTIEMHPLIRQYVNNA